MGANKVKSRQALRVGSCKATQLRHLSRLALDRHSIPGGCARGRPGTVAPPATAAVSTARTPRPPAAPPAAADVAPEVHIDAQVEDEARQHAEDNLLRADGPRE